MITSTRVHIMNKTPIYYNALHPQTVEKKHTPFFYTCQCTHPTLVSLMHRNILMIARLSVLLLQLPISTLIRSPTIYRQLVTMQRDTFFAPTKWWHSHTELKVIAFFQKMLFNITNTVIHIYQWHNFAIIQP